MFRKIKNEIVRENRCKAIIKNKRDVALAGEEISQKEWWEHSCTNDIGTIRDKFVKEGEEKAVRSYVLV